MFKNKSDKKITIEQLLLGKWKIERCNFSDNRAIKKEIKKAPFFVEHGADTLHSTKLTIVLWKLIEAITNKPYHIVVKEQIFDKVGMTQSIAGYDKKLKNVVQTFLPKHRRSLYQKSKIPDHGYGAYIQRY